MTVTESALVRWIDSAEAQGLPSGTYWTDWSKEESKEFNILDGNTKKITDHLATALRAPEQWDLLRRLVASWGMEIEGNGIDLAAGVCWASAWLSGLPGVKRVYAVDLSEHRLTRLAPLVIPACGGRVEKIVRAIGNFYKIPLPAGSLQFCFLAQAFHHADAPDRLLAEMSRLLAPGGLILLMGEEPVGWGRQGLQWVKNMAKRWLPRRFYGTPPTARWFPTFPELFPPDPVLGDHYYRWRDYHDLFDRAGFELLTGRVGPYGVFVARRRPPTATPA